MFTAKLLLLIVIVIALIMFVAFVWYSVRQVRPEVEYRLSPPDKRDMADFDKQLQEREKARKENP